MSNPTIAPQTITNPFRLFRSFSANDAKYFFGREKETAELHQYTLEADSVLVFGHSGTGKTSLVLCGLINKTKHFRWTSIIIRRLGNINDSFAGQLRPYYDDSYVDNAADQNVTTLLKNVYLTSFQPVLLIFDQFEELYAIGSITERKKFYATLKALQKLDFPCKLIFVIRSDFLANVNELELEQPYIFRKKLEILPVTHAGAPRIIIDSFRTFCIPVSIDDQPPAPVKEVKDEVVTVAEQRIAESILEAIAPGETPVQLPYLQVFLFELWEHIRETDGPNAPVTPEAVAWLAGKGNVLRYFLDNRIEQQSYVSKEDAWKVLKLFLSDTEGIKKHVMQIDFEFDAHITDRVNDLKDHFVLTGVIREVSKDIYELAHECLVPIIQSMKISSLRGRLEIPTITGNPYKGLESYSPADGRIFYGRKEVIKQLLDKVTKQPFVAVVGNSGVGKSSLIKAGIFPSLSPKKYHILQVLRAGDKDPLAEINTAVADAISSPEITNILLIDQFEELRTRITNDTMRKNVLDRIHELIQPKQAGDGSPVIQVIITIRADFEPQFSVMEPLKAYWKAGKYIVPPFTREEICEVIEESAYQAGLLFSPPSLSEQIADDVYSSQTTGLLPLMSFCLQQLYEKSLLRGPEDRLLLLSDYENMGGVIGALQAVAEEIYAGLEKQYPNDYLGYQEAVKNITLRMVYSSAGELAGQRVLEKDFVYDDTARNERVTTILGILKDKKLIVSGKTKDGDTYYEPAHDVLVKTWSRIWDWINDSGKDILNVQSRLRFAVAQHAGPEWWDTLLPQPEDMLKIGAGWMNADEQAFVKRHLLHKQKVVAQEKEIEKFRETIKLKAKKVKYTIYSSVIIISFLLFAGSALYLNSQKLKATLADKNNFQNQLVKEKEVSNEQRDKALKFAKLAQDQQAIAVEEASNAKNQRTKADLERAKTIRAYKTIQSITTKLSSTKDSLNHALIQTKVNYINLQRLNFLKDSLYNTTLSLVANIKAKNKESANRLIKIAKGEEMNDPVKAYQMALMAIGQDSGNTSAWHYLDTLYKKPLYFPVKTYTGNYATLSSDGENILLISTTDKKIRLFKRNAAAPFDSLDISDNFKTARFQNNGAAVVVTDKNKVSIYRTSNLRDKSNSSSIEGENITYAAISPDEKMALIIDDGKLKIYGLMFNKERIQPLFPDFKHAQTITQATFSPDSKIVLGTGITGNVYSISTSTGESTFLKVGVPGYQAYLSPTGNYFLTSSPSQFTLLDPKLRVKWQSKKTIGSRMADGVYFSNDGKWLILNYTKTELSNSFVKGNEDSLDSRTVSLIPLTCDDCEASFNAIPISNLLPADIASSNLIRFINNKLFIGRPDKSILYMNLESNQQYRLQPRLAAPSAISVTISGADILTVHGNEVILWQLSTLKAMDRMNRLPKISPQTLYDFSIQMSM